MDCLQFENYLNINTSQYQNLNVETLNHMIERYMLTVPFENISVQNQVPISVNIEDLFRKSS